MLTLTENAQSAIKSIASEAGLGDDGGIRIDFAEDGSQLHMELAQQPGEDDQVVETEGARVFTSPQATTLLAEQELDTAQTPEGAGFTLRKQDGAEAE